MARGDQDQEFNARKISPSRVNQLVSCGTAFRMKYIEGLPEEISGSAALFGSVVHLALEKWAVDRSQDLLTLMRESWLEFCGERSSHLKAFIEEYQALSTRAIRKEYEIREAWLKRGKESKAPRMTKDWKDSDIAKEITRLNGKWFKRLEEHSPYRFTDRDPLPALYDESLVLSKRYEAKWGHLPNALQVELGFEEPWRGYVLHGYIDTIELLLHPETGELQGVGIIDYKTYRNEPAEFKDWRQTVIYYAAVKALVERGALSLPPNVPVYIGADYVRLLQRKFWQPTEEDFARLEAELKSYVNTVEGGNFLPAEKGRNPDFCGYPSSCCLRSTVAAGGSCEPVEVAL